MVNVAQELNGQFYGADEQPRLRGLATVRVNKGNVIEKLRVNRENHRAIFEEAIEGWHKELLKIVEEQVERVKANKRYNPNFYLPQPQDHTSDYDQAIELLEMSLDDELELTAVEFARYVRDDWGWRGDFIGSVSNYASAANVQRYAERQH